MQKVCIRGLFAPPIYVIVDAIGCAGISILSIPQAEMRERRIGHSMPPQARWAIPLSRPSRFDIGRNIATFGFGPHFTWFFTGVPDRENIAG